jgi:hypothetical protein
MPFPLTLSSFAAVDHSFIVIHSSGGSAVRRLLHDPTQAKAKEEADPSRRSITTKL